MPKVSHKPRPAPDSKGGGPRVLGYVRVSTDEQASSGLGLAAQRTAIEKAAAGLGLAVSGWFTDDGVSGSAPLEKRGGLAALLNTMREGDVLLVAKRDRLARDLLLAGWLEKEAARRGARIVSAAGEGTGDDSPTSVLMRQIIDAFAQFERAMIRARTKAALDAKRQRGEKLGGHAPYGYRIVAGTKRLELDPAEQETIRRMVELRAEGKTIREVVATLDAESRHPRNAPRWSTKVVFSILRR